MSHTETVIEGTIQPDGTLVLDEKPNMPAGRVTVVLRREIEEVVIPMDDPFWQRMQAIWDAQKARGHVPRTTEEIDAQIREIRQGAEKRQVAIERLQEESRKRREAAEQEQPS